MDPKKGGLQGPVKFSITLGDFISAPGDENFLQLHTFFPRDVAKKETLRFDIDNQDSINSAIFGGYIDCRRSQRIGS